MRFESPNAFLAYLKQHLAAPIPRSTSDPGFAAHIAAQAKSTGTDREVLQFGGLDLAVEDIVRTIFEKLPAEAARSIQKSIAIGTLDIGSINARIVRSPDGHFAVLVHRGLMLFLSKATKLILAWGAPGQVVYCNRMDADKLTVSDIKQFLWDLIENTNGRGAPYGAMIHLTPQLSASRAWTVHIMEMFVVCHELGHYLNGDLRIDTDFQVFEEAQTVYEYMENRDHEKEFAADATAFQLMCDAMGLVDQARLQIMVALVQLFNLLYLLGGRESVTHPHPLERTRRLFQNNFGSKASDTYVASYEDHSKIEELFAGLRHTEVLTIGSR